MRKYLLPSALILAFGIALAGAQVITKSLQVTQDPRSPVGLDASNNSYFPAHVLMGGSQNTAPTTATCGSGGTPAVTGTDNAGIVTEGAGTGAGVTGCTVYFNQPFNSNPVCVMGVGGANGQTATPTGYTASATGFTVVNSAATSGGFSYFCTAKN